ncbi:MAG: hypothetical protein IJX01_04855 [Oscillospiraceae bacterium]|nr:hypothetical protein [Oscillospiraceae bacterium]
MKEYVLRIVAAAIVCAVASGLLGNKTPAGRVVMLVSGILMAITIITPLSNITFSGISNFWDDLSEEASKYAQEGAYIAEKQEKDIIKSQTEAYILDKANRMGLQIAVEVELDGHNRNIPCGVVISGNISPYSQIQLESYIEQTLGIAKENQKWK